MASLTIQKNKLMLLFLLLLNSEILFLTGWKRSGITYFREIFLFTITTITIIHFTKKLLSGKPFKKVEIQVLAIVLIGVLSPSAHAWIMYGQPILYGILEERRLFSYLSFFPLLALLMRTPLKIDKALLMVGFSILTISSLYALGIIPENARPSYSVEERSYGNNDPRYATRFPINTNQVFFIYCISLATCISYGRLVKAHIAYIVAALLYVLLIDQGRTNLLMFLFAGGLSVLASKLKHRTLGLLSVIAALALMVIPIIGIDSLIPNFDFIVAQSSSPIESQVRYNTVSIILSNLKSSYFFGWGALSLQWNEGFHRFYGQNFYLSDVSLFGTLFRHGWIFPIFIAIFITTFYTAYKNMENSELKSGIKITLISFLVFGFFNGKIEYAGSTLTLILALCIAHRTRKEYRSLNT
ncbi:hypothetical protein [Pseudomonas sp. ACN5]|uniref:hypothetical protein n=1 Tax=Pseudomonas sp. ACN5 TaxID=1920427 RepID=UPI0011432B6A|nr:hypothetical protein [Pseudomonas sp. ACN5]PBJ06969.1 hypothetical protein BSF40_22690 [Pseudomonas sp. ACN5]